MLTLPRPSADPEPRRPRAAPSDVALCTLLAAVSLALAWIGHGAHSEALELIGAYDTLFLGIGAAPFQLLPRMSPWARLTAAILVGFAVLLVVGALMADIRVLWQPVAWALGVGAASAALHLIGLLRLLRHRPRRRSLRVGKPAGAAAPAGLSLGLAAIGTALWLVPSLSTHDNSPGIAGFLTVISPAWYLGLVVVIVAFVVGRRVAICAGAATFSLGLATTLTPALVYATPRLGTAAKQMVLTQYVLVHHHVDVTAGIYRAYSALFGGVAWLCDLLGIHGLLGPHSLIGLATYWPVLILVMRIVILRLLAGRILTGTTRRWSAVMLVLLVDSLGDDYFSPQSVGYVLAFGAFAMVLRGSSSRPLHRRGTFWVLLAAGLALAPTHELSPYVAAGGLIVLAVFAQAPRWAFLPILVPAAAWAGVVHRTIANNFSFAQLFSFANFRPPLTLASPGLHRLAIVDVQSRTLLAALLALIVLAAIGFFTNVRRGWAWSYGLAAVVGLALIAVNPYGHEGIFRASLFAIPWLAVLAMEMPRPGRLLPVLRRRALTPICTGAVLIALLGTFLVAAYGMDAVDVMDRSDVAAVSHLQALPPRNAFVLGIGSEFNPAGYPPFTIDYTALEWDQVDYARGVRSRHPTQADLTSLAAATEAAARRGGGTRSSPIYLYWSRSLLLYAQAYALLSPRQMRGWLRLLKASPDWRLVAHDGSAYLFERRQVRHQGIDAQVLDAHRLGVGGG